MIGPNKFRTYLSAAVAASLMALSVAGCTSSQLEQGPEHPASAEAPVAPLQPVGKALSNDGETARGDVSPAPNPHEAHGQHGSGTEPGAAGQAHPSNSAGGSEHSEHARGADSPPAPSGGGSHAAHDGHESAAESWTCTMHPEVSEPKPGKCPKCGMNLVPAEPKSAP